MSPVTSPRPNTTIYGRRECNRDGESNESTFADSTEEANSPQPTENDQPTSPCIPYVSSRSPLQRSSTLPQTQLEVLSKIFPAYPTDLLQITLMEARGSVSQAVEKVLYGPAQRGRYVTSLRTTHGSSAFKETERCDYGLTTLSTLSTLVRYCNRCGYRAFATDNFCSTCGCILRRR